MFTSSPFLPPCLHFQTRLHHTTHSNLHPLEGFHSLSFHSFYFYLLCFCVHLPSAILTFDMSECPLVPRLMHSWAPCPIHLRLWTDGAPQLPPTSLLLAPQQPLLAVPSGLLKIFHSSPKVLLGSWRFRRRVSSPGLRRYDSCFTFVRGHLLLDIAQLSVPEQNIYMFGSFMKLSEKVDTITIPEAKWPIPASILVQILILCFVARLTNAFLSSEQNWWSSFFIRHESIGCSICGYKEGTKTGSCLHFGGKPFLPRNDIKL